MPGDLTTDVTWVALPAHVDDAGRVLVNAHASIRLGGGDGVTLDDVGGPARSWAESVAGMTFSVDINGTLHQGLVPITSPTPGLWEALFPPDTPVGTWVRPAHEDKAVHTWSVADLLAEVAGLYGTTAASPDGLEPPLVDDVAGPFARVHPWRGVTTFRPPSWDGEQGGDTHPGVVDNQPSGGPSGIVALEDLHRFYDRPWFTDAGGGQTDPAIDPGPYAPEFHERLALLGDHPRLLRRLGIVCTLRLPLIVADLPPQGTVAVLPTAEVPDTGIPPSVPRTAWEADADRRHFFVRPQLAEPHLRWLAHGWLALGDPDLFTTYQVDLDGIGLKLAGFAASLGQFTDGALRGPLDPLRSTLPSLRTGGWTVARHDAASSMFSGFTTMASLEAAAGPVLHAEQLVRGVRVDVEDAATWRSLQARQVRHALTAPGAPAPISYTDEGFAKLGVATSNPTASDDGGAPADDLYVHEALVGWDGWSLVVPRPGRHLPRDDDGGSANHTTADYDEADPTGALGMTTEARAADATLPRLRVGREYALRARVVDLAGTSRPLDDPHFDPTIDNAPLSTPPARHRRWEPVHPPNLVRTRDDTEGEGIDHLVIRSSGDLDPQPDPWTHATSLNAEVGHDRYRGVAERWLLPPRASVAMAEAHGAFDAILDGNEPDALERLYDVATREQRSLGADDDPISSTHEDHRDEQGNPVPYVIAETLDAKDLHLPDPWAAGMLLVVRHEAQEVSLPVDWSGTWPDLEPRRLRLASGPTVSLAELADPASPPGSPDVIVLTVPAGEQVTLELSSTFAEEHLDLFGVWHWAKQANAAGAAAVRTAAVQGRHWMLSPRHTLTATHAVERPLPHALGGPGKPSLPDSTGLVVHRHPGATDTILAGTIRTHAASTARIDVMADWVEPVDDPSRPPPSKDDDAAAIAGGAPGWPFQRRRARAFEVAVGSAEDEVVVTMVDPDGPALEAEGTSRFRRCVRCATLVPEGKAGSPCPARAPQAPSPPHDHHVLVAPEHYALVSGPAGQGTSPRWRGCQKCASAFWFDPLLPTESCPGGGLHAPGDEVSVPGAGPGQPAWRRCKHCTCLFLSGVEPRACWVGDRHEPVGPAQVVPRMDRLARHEFGDTRHRRVAYSATATSRYREFQPVELVADTERLVRREQVGDPPTSWTLQVPSSAHPAPPDVERVLPTMAWEEEISGGARIRRRRGGGVRIWLRRPWYSSGDGELLGVVTADLPDGQPLHVNPLTRAPLGQYVTTYGSDPVWDSSGVPAIATTSHFPLALPGPSNASRTLVELPKADVVVAAHAVQWDWGSRRWYADLQVDLGDVYFPFVRLSLVRLQPSSLPGLSLSPTVTDHTVQVVPDRETRLRIVRGGTMVTVSGPVGSNDVGAARVSALGPRLRARPIVRVDLQEDVGGRGDLGWRTVHSTDLDLDLDGFRGTWRGVVPPGGSPQRPRRLHVQEFQTFLQDEDPSPSRDRGATAERVVFADDFLL